MTHKDQVHNVRITLEELFENYGAGVVTEALWQAVSGYATTLPARQPTQVAKREAADLWSRVVVASRTAMDAGAALSQSREQRESVS